MKENGLGLGEISSMGAPTSPLDGTILKLPGKLDNLLRHGCTLPKGVADEIPLIKLDLEKIIAISSNLQEDDLAMMVRCWRKEVRELSYDIEDFLDQYEHDAAMNCARSIRGREITRRSKSKRTLPWIREKLKQRLWMANKIREFSERAQEALERHRLYNLDAIAGSASFRCTGDAYPTSWNGKPCGEDKAYVGIDAAMEELEELLMMTHDQGHQKLQVVSIVRFGGIGKTTLAMELYRKLGQQFECRAFVRTSQKPDMRRIFISMLSQVRPHQPPDNWTVHGLISTIRTHLQDKRYLIIVEDLWTTSTWDIVKHALPDSNCCSRILTTTEIEDLALQSCDHDPKYVYKMQPLGEDNSRKLFLSSVFGPQDECPPELREISHDIIRKCGGLPLAIVTVASILSSQPGKQDRWDYVNKAIGYSLLTNPTWEGMKQIFDISYNNLPQHLKACILYTGLYEEDIVIWKDDLINQWLAEGFIQATEGQDKKEIARSFFDRLINGKLILPVDVNRNGEVLSCTIHHMVLNLVIRCKSIEENFVIGIHHSQATTTLTDKVRRLSLQFGNAEDAITPPNMRLSHVRTLAFWGVFKCLPSDVQFRLLQVLILHFWGDKDSISFDITTISELFRLRYLKVTSNVTLELRTQMRGLKSLETLTIDARVSSVPSDIVHLPGLQHLSLPAETNLPSGIGHMTSLRMLGCFDISSNSIENVQSLSMLTNLGDLQLTCSTVQIENLNIKMQLLLNSVLGRLSNLKSLTLASRAPSYAKSFCATGMTISGGVSSLSSAPALLRSLEVSPQICIFFYTPKWIGQLRELCVLKFGVRRLDRDGVDVLRGLPALSVLTLYVQTKPAARIVIGKTGFPVLKYFRFKCCDALLEFEEGAMPNLRKLKLAFHASNADQQSTIPVGIEYLSELKEVSAKIGGVGPEESHRRAAELAFRDAIRVHAGFQRVNVRCVKQIIECKDDQSSVTTVEYSDDKTVSNLSRPLTLANSGSLAARLSLKNLREITDDFSDMRVLGQGGLSTVYKGVLANGDTIAVKKLAWTMSRLQDEQYENEARHLMRLKHPNIVQLVGYCSETVKEIVLHNGTFVCAERPERLLCLEYLPNGSLCQHLSGASSGLDWDTRYKIIRGICDGLHYLHEEWQAGTPIIHGDLKPANILLDDNMVPKITDFGLSRLFGEGQTQTITKHLPGTLGYMPPEYFQRGIITKKLDIFSLGVIIIEITTGDKYYPYNVETSSEEFIELVLTNWKNRLEIVQGYTSREFDCQQIRRCIEIGLLCVNLDPAERPTTRQIIKMLLWAGAECNNMRQMRDQICRFINPLFSKLETMDSKLRRMEEQIQDITVKVDNIARPSPDHHNHEQFRQETNQEVKPAEAEGLASTKGKGENTSIRLRFLNEMNTQVYHDDEIKSDRNTAISIGIFNGEKMIESGELSNVQIEIFALEGDFPYASPKSWTAKKFNKHRAKARDGRGNVLAGEGIKAQLKNGQCDLGSIKFTENSSKAHRGKFIIGARVCEGEVCGIRVQEAVMDPVVVQDRRNKFNEKRHLPKLDDPVHRLKEIAKDGIYCKRLEKEKILTVQDFLKALNKDPEKLAKVLQIKKEHRNWMKIVEHASRCPLRRELKSYHCPETNIVLFFNCVHGLVGAEFDGLYTACGKFDQDQQDLVDKLKGSAYDLLDALRPDYVMTETDNFPQPLTAYIGSAGSIAGAGPSNMPRDCSIIPLAAYQVAGVPAVESSSHTQIESSIANTQIESSIESTRSHGLARRHSKEESAAPASSFPADETL